MTKPTNLAQYEFDWADLAFSSKEPLKTHNGAYIVAPREMTQKGFDNLIKKWLPKGNIVFGISKEPFVLGFEHQPQFKMLTKDSMTERVALINARSPHKIAILQHSQLDTVHILDAVEFAHVIFVNGSWQRSFHLTPYFALLSKTNQASKYTLESPFVNEDEAKDTAKKLTLSIQKKLALPAEGTFSQQEMVNLANRSAQQSFDHTFQTGAAIGKKTGKKYKLLLTAFNEIMPYQTYAMHHGASREIYFSPPNDLNHYDTVHAEIQAIITAMQKGIRLKGLTLFVNLMPCPVCSRALVKSGLTEIIYEHDHSDGYAIKLLTQAGITVQRHVG